VADFTIEKLMKERAAVKARLDKLDAHIALLSDPWTKRQGKGRHYGAAARKRMSDAAIGSVIVADGHAALFSGVVKVGSDWQLIIYDANDQVGWTVSLDGTPSKDDPDDKMLSFPGHVVGQHVTREQWGTDHLVKVFQPIGYHPVINLDPDPRYLHRDGRKLHPHPPSHPPPATSPLASP
jgi:hypothetical protein